MKKSSKSFLAIICLFSLLLFGTNACEQSNGQQEGQKTELTDTGQSSETTSEKLQGNAGSTSNGKTWPDEIPTDVPQFGYGNLDEVKKNDSAENLTWVLKFSGTSENDIVTYEAILKEAGFKPSRMAMGNKGTMIIGLKNDLTVTINNTATTATIGVNKAKK